MKRFDWSVVSSFGSTMSDFETSELDSESCRLSSSNGSLVLSKIGILLTVFACIRRQLKEKLQFIVLNSSLRCLSTIFQLWQEINIIFENVSFINPIFLIHAEVCDVCLSEDDNYPSNHPLRGRTCAILLTMAQDFP